MRIEILGSIKPKYALPVEEAKKFAGRSAGICYLPDTLEELFNEPEEKTMRRADMTLISGHHSVYDHPIYNLALIEIPKILAMILNNEKMYTTSEKSGRYTKMTPSKEEEKKYLKWIEIFQTLIQKEYPKIDDKKAKKLAQENARKTISIFTPATTMEYTVSIRQLNYILHWFKKYINEEKDDRFNKLLKPWLQKFINEIKELEIPELNTDVKQRGISLFAKRKRQEEFGENYSINYLASCDHLAQAQRHRTIKYEITIPEKIAFQVPDIIKGTEYEKEWIKDLEELKHLYPIATYLEVNERGTAEDFILKSSERLCGAAQLEIAKQTKETLEKYLKNVKETNKEVYEYLKKYNTGARCTFPGFKCTSPCVFGPKEALNRKI